MWVLGIDYMVEEYYPNAYHVNQLPTQIIEKHIMSVLPERPWQNISIDFCELFPSGEYLLLLIDEYLRYPVVYAVKTPSSKASVPKLNHAMSALGIPDVIKTDNGREEFTHRKITPEWPRASTEAESFMKTIEKAVRTRTWKASLGKKN